MLLLPTSLLVHSLAAATVAVVYATVLLEPGMILFPLWKRLDRFNSAHRWAYLLTKPLGLCLACCAGQIALWSWIVVNWPRLLTPGGWIELIVTVAATIYLALLLEKLKR